MRDGVGGWAVVICSEWREEGQRQGRFDGVNVPRTRQG